MGMRDFWEGGMKDSCPRGGDKGRVCRKDWKRGVMCYVDGIERAGAELIQWQGEKGNIEWTCGYR